MTSGPIGFVATRLASERGIDVNNPNLDEMDIRWDIAKQSAVLLPAFLAAYSGSDASGVSLGIFKFPDT
jgi:hypothetical protein